MNKTMLFSEKCLAKTIEKTINTKTNLAQAMKINKQTTNNKNKVWRHYGASKITVSFFFGSFFGEFFGYFSPRRRNQKSH